MVDATIVPVPKQLNSRDENDEVKAGKTPLPKDWADDAERRNKAHVPEAIRFKTKPQIALGQLGAALAAGAARGVVLMDASYGTNSALRAGIGALSLTYVAAILATVKVRAVADPDRRVSAKGAEFTEPRLAHHHVA